MFGVHDSVTTDKLGTSTEAAHSPGDKGTRPECLVIGHSDSRLTLFAQAAREAGFSTTSCDDVKAARTHMLRGKTPMAIVDLEDASGSSPADLKKLAEKLARQKNAALLVLCGNDGNSMEEIWASQLGVWLYLPGVADESDLVSLFEEANEIAGRKTQATRAESYFPPSTAATA